MRTVKWPIAILAVLFLCAASAVAQPDAGAPDRAPQVSVSTAASGRVIVCPINEMVDEGLSIIVNRAVDESKNAEALVFEVDTFGGRVDSAFAITDSIMRAECKTIAYIIGDGAISAGAIISFACDEIVMKPGTTIGASTPIIMGQETTEAVEEKSMSFLRAKFRALAEENGHNPLLGEAMVDPAIELYIDEEADGRYMVYKVQGGKVVESAPMQGAPSAEAPADEPATPPTPPKQQRPAPVEKLEETVRNILGVAGQQPEPEPKPEEQAEPAPPLTGADVPETARLLSPAGKLVTLSSGEALRYGLISATPQTLDDALAHFELEKLERRRIIITWSEALFRWLSSPIVSSLLLLIGFGGIYIEIRTPGIGIPGLIGAIALALFFGSHLVIGLADWADLLLVIVGVGLLLVEFFVIPGFGFVGVAGIVCFFMGLYLALTRVPIPEYTWDYERLDDALRTLLISLVLFVVFAVGSWKLFPRSPFYKMLVLADAQNVADGYTVQPADKAGAVGKQGVAVSMLRPVGRGRFEGETLSVMTRGEFIDKDRPIRIVQVEGNRYVVEEIGEETEQA